jgi:hypothetical protein
MSRKNVHGRWIGLALAAALAVTAPAGASGFPGSAPPPLPLWDQVWTWVLGGLQRAGAPVAPLLSAAFGEVGMHIDPNGTEPTADPTITVGSSLDSGNISVTVDPGQ